MQRLLILRHGKAEPWANSDEERALTDRGRRQVAAVCDAHAADLSAVHAIWASPFVRTQQTAEIVAKHFDLPLVTKSFLTSETPPSEVLDALSAAKDKKFPLLLVSHQPLVGELVNGLCGSGGAHPMGTSTLACLESDVWANGCAELQWLFHPEV